MIRKNGFTLIEIMIAISIIAIIATIGFGTYSQSQVRGRDLKRKQDLRAISTALELYYQQNKVYPNISFGTLAGGCSDSGSGYTLCLSNNSSMPWVTGLTSAYIASTPTDPIGNNGDPITSATTYGYAYRSYNANNCSYTNAGQIYILYARLENASDPDRLGATNYNFCNGTALSSILNNSANLYVIRGY